MISTVLADPSPSLAPALSQSDAGNLLGLALLILLVVGSELTLRRIAKRSNRDSSGRAGGMQPVMTAPRAQHPSSR